MRTMRLVFATVALSAAILGCSSNKPTSPSGGGGGGGSSGGNTPFDSGTLTAPATFVRSFPSAGTVSYICRFHVSMGMTGTVTVTAGGADQATVTASGTTFSPSTVSIKPGGTVTWNVTNGTHTVTSN